MLTFASVEEKLMKKTVVRSVNRNAVAGGKMRQVYNKNIYKDTRICIIWVIYISSRGNRANLQLLQVCSRMDGKIEKAPGALGSLLTYMDLQTLVWRKQWTKLVRDDVMRTTRLEVSSHTMRFVRWEIN